MQKLIRQHDSESNDTSDGRTESSTDSRNPMDVQDLGQLHRLFDLVNHHLTWNEANDDKSREQHEYDTTHPDWAHLRELPSPSETDAETYNPSLDEWKEIGVKPTNFLESRDEIESAMLALSSGIANELEEMEDKTASIDRPTVNNEETTEQLDLELFGD